jgi:hypothetical protein
MQSLQNSGSWKDQRIAFEADAIFATSFLSTVRQNTHITMQWITELTVTCA